MSFSPGDLIGGKYRIVRLIGDGGMGTVYEALHELLGAPVALKFLHAELAQRPGLAARFLQEARVSATIQSPHVTRVTDVDTATDGSPYLVMELLTGESLQRLLDRRGMLTPDEAIDFALQILAGLEAAHALGVVHRDLKPDNVFVTTSGSGPLLKLIDFGIAKLRETSEYKKSLTRAGVVMGTPEYMPPEQLYAASEVDPRADLYSLGVLLFEMLSGSRPADGDSADAIVTQVLSGNVKRLGQLSPDLRPELIALVEKALAGDREQRFESAYAMRQALSDLTGELSHAGRLAATSAHLAPRNRVTSEPFGPAATPLRISDTAVAPVPPAGLPDTLDAPVPGVPETLPPRDEPMLGGQTQAAPPAFTPGILHQPVKRRRKRSRLWVLAVGATLLLTALGLVIAKVWLREGRRQARSVIPTSVVPTSKATIEPIVIPTPPETPALPATRSPDRRVPPAPRVPGPTDAGAPPSFQPLPFPSFALPSSFPPLPTTLPTALPLPPGFPEIPGLTPPAPPSSPTDAGTPGP